MCSFFCEYWKDIIVAFIGAFFGFGLALLIEYWNIRSNKKKEKESFKEEMASKIEYYTILLDEVVMKTQKQVELINKNVEEQNENLPCPISLKYIHTNFFTRLKNIDGRGVFEALNDKFKLDKDWIKKYNNLNSYLDFLEGTLCGELVRINKKTLKKGYEDLLFVKYSIDIIPNILSKEAMIRKQELGESRFNDKEYVFIDNTIKTYTELVDKKVNLDKFNTELLEPLLKNIAPYEEKIYAQDVIFKCKNARVRMTDMRSDIGNTVSTYGEIIKSLSTPIEEVKKMITLLKE